MGKPGSDRPVTVTEAVRLAHLAISVPTGVLLVAPLIGLLLINPLPELLAMLGSVLAGLLLAWSYRTVATPRWRVWAYRSVEVEDRGEVRAQAIWAGLAWPRGHLLERLEWKSLSLEKAERELEREYLRRNRFWPETPSYESSPEKDLRLGAAVMAFSLGGLLLWRVLSPNDFMDVKANSVLLYLSAVGATMGILYLGNDAVAQALSGYGRPLVGLLVLLGVTGLVLVDYGLILEAGIYLTAPAIIPVVLALLGLKR